MGRLEPVMLFIILCIVGYALRSIMARSNPKEQMHVIIENWNREHVEKWWTGEKSPPFEIREYTHPLLKKYLPTYRFYVPYFHLYKARWYESTGNYVTTLGIGDRSNHLLLFDNSLRKGTTQDLVQGFLKGANIKTRLSPSLAELREITTMFGILSSLKGLNGYGVLKADERGLPIIREIKPESFKLEHTGSEITVSYKLHDDREIFKCILHFDSTGKILRGQAFRVPMKHLLRSFLNAPLGYCLQSLAVSTPLFSSFKII